MDAPASSGRRVRTGLFEIDFGSVEVHKEGRRIPLQEQPFRVLGVLLERPGEVITREELQARLWPTDTFVGFDEGINTAIRKLRVVFGDSADNPRFIETLPRRGYRFIAPVQDAVAEPAQLSEHASGISPGLSSDARPDAQQLEPNADSVRSTVSGKAEVASGGGKYWKLAIPVALAVMVLSAGRYSYLHRKVKLTETDTIVLADFSNSTGDAVFDDTLKTALTISLRQSPFLNVLPDSQVATTLQLMTRPADTRLTPDVARELCLRAGSKAYIAGAIGSLGSEYVLGLKAVNCHNGDTLAQEQITATSREKVLDTLGKAASGLRTELGESLATVQTFDVPLAEATTSSLEALKAYSLGAKAFHEKGAAAALPFNQRAIELDPSFAMGYRAVGVEYNTLAEVERASEYYTRAFQLREHTSEREKLEIIAGYHATVTGDVDKAVQVYEQKLESYPRDALSYLNLGVEYAAQGQYEEAASVTRQGVRLALDQSRFYSALSGYALASQRFGDSRQAIRDAQARKLDDYSLHCDLYAIAFLEADSAAMAEQQQWLARNAESETFGLALASDTEAYGGHLSKARELTRRAVDSARRADSKENGAVWQTNAALREAAYGNRREARQTAAEALELAPASQGAKSEAALAFAMAGETVRAESLAQDLGKRFPLDTQIRSLWLPAIRAQLALNKKNPVSALSALQAASAIELGNIQFANNLSCLYHVYLRGQAYLAAKQGPAAAAEFQKIIDHGGIVWNCWTGALAHLGVARANALQAKNSQGAEADAARVRALAAYKDFLTLWKDADPDIPILKEARAEYAKLQ
jgi:DNA-binding winged helix-turn-helix (wHTH) protein/tetratricopeptide (TPR) repeat protein